MRSPRSVLTLLLLVSFSRPRRKPSPLPRRPTIPFPSRTPASPTPSSPLPNPSPRQADLQLRLRFVPWRQRRRQNRRRQDLKVPDLTDPAASKDRTDGEIFYIIKTGHGDMPPEGNRVKTEQLWDLVNYVRTFAKKQPPAESKPATLDRRA